MPRKKKPTKEEVQAEINRIVEERLKIDREINHTKSVESFLRDSFQLLRHEYFFGDLKMYYVFDTAKNLINDSGLSEEKKEELRNDFASGMIFGRGGVKQEDWDAAMEGINNICKYLRGQT